MTPPAFHNSFRKQYKKLSKDRQKRTKLALGWFMEDPFDERLDNHSLQGNFTGHRSIKVDGDMRAIYQVVGNTPYFTHVGTHAQLYK